MGTPQMEDKQCVAEADEELLPQLGGPGQGLQNIWEALAFIPRIEQVNKKKKK